MTYKRILRIFYSNSPLWVWGDAWALLHLLQNGTWFWIPPWSGWMLFLYYFLPPQGLQHLVTEAGKLDAKLCLFQLL